MSRRIRRVLAVSALIFSVGLSLGCERKAEKSEAEAESPAPAAEQESQEPKEKTEETTEPAGPPKTLEELPEGVNAVQNEMRLLNTAMRNVLTLIANDQLDGIPKEIKKVHPARQLTMKAVKKGVYEPPVNAEKMDEFKQLDDEFHKSLKGLLKASKNDDLQAATDHYSDLVQGCTDCHTKFRFAD